MVRAADWISCFQRKKRIMPVEYPIEMDLLGVLVLEKSG